MDRGIGRLEEMANWDPRYRTQFLQDGLIDVVREVMWATCGFPHVVFESRTLVATYAFTRVPTSVVGAVTLPWPAFTIDFTPNDLPIRGTYVRRVSVMGPRPTLRENTLVQMHFASGLDSASYYRSLTEDDDVVVSYPPYAPEEFRASEAEGRLSAAVRRLVANVVLALTNKDNYVHTSRTLGPKGSYERRMSRLPQTEQYILGRGIKLNLDLRRELCEYVAHGDESRRRGPATVQTLVAGHGKWQVHGPGRAGRKWIFIQPYWRGPEDAPIVVRPHVLVAKPGPEPEGGGEKQ
jgi:hypothetical protein